MINQLVSLSNHLDLKGYTKEASYLDNIIRKMADSSYIDETPNVPPEGFDRPAFVDPGYDPDTNEITELTDEDYRLDSERNSLWEDIKQLARDRGYSDDQLYRLIDDKTNIIGSESIGDEISGLKDFKETL